jgi:uncharacterized membrane protein
MNPNLPLLPIHPPSPLVEQTLEKAIAIVRPGFHMGIDILLALFPFMLALLLFRRGIHLPRLVWWPLLGVFILFLPNAPYILTDVIHFVDKIRVTPPLPLWAVSLLLLEYNLYFLFGMQCFTLSMMLWGDFLKRHGRGWLVLPTEGVVIALSSFAIYLGRINRLNSWDVVTDPNALVNSALRDVFALKSREITLVFFVTVTLVHYLLKAGNLLLLRILRNRGVHAFHDTLQGISGVSRTSRS